MDVEQQIYPEDADETLINDAFETLLNSYLASRHRKKVDLITKAFNFAKQAHRGVRRLSGEPYIMHPIAVAQIACAEIGLGSTSICAALLHDVVEDTDYTVEDISNIFGEKIAMIVDGLTKISGGIFGEQASAQAENFKKLLLTMSDDIRVILMIAGETLYIYAPLANRLGLNKVKSELENLSFKFEHPEEYASIEAKLQSTRASRDELFSKFTEPIEAALKQMGIQYEIKERVKTPYSIWSKMQNKHVTFEEIYDILAVRIIFTPNVREDEVNECFKIYVAISKIYKSHPDRLRDWLSQPKANGYQALHVTLMSKQGRWIEVQIRSDRMNEIAEQGFAAHWKYKDGVDSEYTEDENELNEWLGTIKEILDDPQPDAMDFLDTIKLNLFASEIFVFTPKGEIRTLPAGCTALDFAFSIHTFLGSHCIGAKVNHKLVPLSHKLNSGDQVEILTSKSQHVSPSWINFVSTAKAKAKIQAIRRRDNREVQREGEEILNNFLEQNGFEPSVSLTDQLTEFHGYNKPQEFFLALGEKVAILGEKDIDRLNGKKEEEETGGWRKYVPFMGKKKQEEVAEQSKSRREFFVVPEKFNRKKPIYISEENISQYKFPGCCHPIPGDDALGYINNKKQIEIHKRACPVAAKLKTSFGNKILDIKWDMHKVLFFEATIRISGIDRKVTITCEDGIFDGSIELKVHDRDDVKKIINNLKHIPDLKEISEIM